MPTFYEFFAGGGMARAGLGPEWNCIFANDYDHRKAAAYRSNWGTDALQVEDVKKLTTGDLPSRADLAWASFPCQDLSLAGGGAGLRGERSGTFWPFWRLVSELRQEGRAPSLVVLENVCGTLTSHGGKDFATISSALAGEGYRFGAMVIDAQLFVPHSRPRLFFVGVRTEFNIPRALVGPPSPKWHTKALVAAQSRLPAGIGDAWVWWNMPAPPRRSVTLADIVDTEGDDVAWHTPAETQKLLSMMSELNLRKLEAVKRYGRPVVGTLYRRTRPDSTGMRVQRAEVRFDDVAGCLRTPAGGSSRQIVVVVEGGDVRTRLISTRETARLMGLPDTYQLPRNYNEAYHLTGDGVVVPVVTHLARNVLEAILLENAMRESAA